MIDADRPFGLYGSVSEKKICPKIREHRGTELVLHRISYLVEVLVYIINFLVDNCFIAYI